MDGLVDIKDVLNNPACRSLKALTEAVIGVKLTKNKRECMSNWERQCFTEAQIVYAALDAWVASECYEVMMQKTVVCATVWVKKHNQTIQWFSVSL